MFLTVPCNVQTFVYKYTLSRQLAKQAIPAGKKIIVLVPPDGTICMNYLFQSTILSIEQAGCNQLIAIISLKVIIYIEAVFKLQMSVQPSSVVFRHKQLH